VKRPAPRPVSIAIVAIVVILLGVGLLWTQVIQGGDRHLAWQDVTGRMGTVLWPKSVSRSFWKQRQLDRYVARTFPEGAPRVPRFDFLHRRLILVAAGPRSSTGYRVRIVQITERRSTIDVLAREDAPTLGQGQARLTSPYRLVTIPATSKRVYVQWQGRP
jgi:hypothetical protein